MRTELDYVSVNFGALLKKGNNFGQTERQNF